jgi:hypothetical protein
MDRGFTVERLAWRDVALGEIALPRETLRLTLGLGSGLGRAWGGPPDLVWAVGDRGPNLKIEAAVDRYGLEHLRPLSENRKAKVLPRLDLGPFLAELRIEVDAVELVRVLPLRRPDGRALSGLPPPGGEAEMEPAFDLEGRRLAPDPDGADTEAVAPLSDGSFWVAEEYGASLLKVAPDGVVQMRWIPTGTAGAFNGAGCPVEEALPAAAARRRLNRGFEGLALSPDERWLYAGFQSSLADDPQDIGRIWKLDASSGALAGDHIYPFDPPESFRRDVEARPPDASDLKVCEIICIGDDRLLVLERITHSAKIYRVDLNRGSPLEKTLVLSTDDTPEIGPDLEGMALLSNHELLVVSDNDFGVEGAPTRFFRIRFDAPLAG